MAATMGTPQYVQNTGPIGPTIRTTLTTLTPDASYPTGGYAVTAAQLGLSSVAAVVAQIAGSGANNTAIQASYNAATGKVQLWASTGTSPVGLAEVANTTNCSGITATLIGFGF